MAVAAVVTAAAAPTQPVGAAAATPGDVQETVLDPDESPDEIQHTTIRAVSVHYPCSISALPVHYPCINCTLSVLYPCAICALSVHYPCTIRALPVDYPCTIRALSVH